MANEFWDRRINILNIRLAQTKQAPLNEDEKEKMKAAWEDTFTKSKVIDPTQVGTLLNELIVTMKTKLEEFGRKYYGRTRVWS